MKKHFLLLALILFAGTTVFAQVQFNPQIGGSMMGFSNPKAGTEYTGKFGALVGADIRFGEGIQFIPGVYYVASQTGVVDESGSVDLDDVVKHNYLKLKALVGLNLINGKAVKLRVNAGPSYDFLMSAKLKDAGDDLKDDFKNGTFYLQGGLGLDLLIFTADVGYAQGLSKTFANEGAPDAKTKGFYVTVGVILGSGKK